jgi:hypothetical protein
MLRLPDYRKSAQESGQFFSSAFLFYASIRIHVEFDSIFRMVNPRKNEICCRRFGKTAFFFKVEVVIICTLSTLKIETAYSSKQQ